MKNLLEYKNHLGSVEFSSDDEVFHGKLEGIRDLVTYEATDVEGLKRAFQEAVEDYVATCEKKNKKPEKAFKGVFNVRVRPELHRRAFVYSEEHHMKLNNVVSEALEKFLQGAH
jgi:predicted HicB family RNase H-like nuclease